MIVLKLERSLNEMTQASWLIEVKESSNISWWKKNREQRRDKRKL